MDVVLLGCAAFLAGLVDAVVGGGGLIQIPVLFAVFPKEIPATLLGTSKLAGVFGTSAAALNYARRVRVAWSAAAPAAMAAFALSFLGAYTVTQFSGDFIRSLLPVVLIVFHVEQYRCRFWTFVSRETIGQTSFCFVPRGTSLPLHR